MKLQVIKTDKGYVAITKDLVDMGKPYLMQGIGTEIRIRGEKHDISWTKWASKIVATDTSFKLERIPQFELEKTEDDEPLAETDFNHLGYKTGKQDFKVGFVRGYRAAKEKGCYTEEDMENAFLAGEKWEARNQSIDRKEPLEFTEALNVHEFIDSLKQPKQLVAIEVESGAIGGYTQEGGTYVHTYFQVTKSEEYLDGLLTIKQYFYE